MNEFIIQNLWDKQLFDTSNLKLSDGSHIKILYKGTWNKNSGPDFSFAKIKINDVILFGDIEIHKKSSDWDKHEHYTASYNKVVLHVVWEDDKQIAQSNFEIPTLIISKFVPSSIIKFKDIIVNKSLICTNIIDSFPENLWEKYSLSIFKQRIFNKSLEIKDLLRKTKNDWENVFFIIICKYFGTNINKNAFYNLSNSFNFKVIRSLSDNLNSLEALMFGQAGFLDTNINSDYIMSLKKEYTFIKTKYNLQEINKEQFKYSKLRPYNFPTIKLSQLCNLYHNNKSLFSSIATFKEKKDLMNILNVKTSIFWETHFTFEKESKKEEKKISDTFKSIVIINSIVPILFEFANSKNDNILYNKLLELCYELKAERNNITRLFSEKLKINNCIHSQALIELHSNYCIKNKCLECYIFNHTIKKGL